MALCRRGRRVACCSAWLLAVQPDSAPQIAYATQPAEKGDITVEVSATGTLQPLIQVDISSELSGVVRSVAVDENQLVKKGDVLAELDTVRLAAQIERAQGIRQGRRGQGH